MKLNGLENYFETFNDKIIDLKQVDDEGWSPLKVAFGYNKSDNLNLNQNQFDYLIKNSDLKEVSINGISPLMVAFSNNTSQNVNLSAEQWNYIIKNSDLKKFADEGWSPLMIGLRNNKEENLNLNNESWKYLINNSDISLITNDNDLNKLKKIQSELLNAEILNKIDIKEKKQKRVKI